MATGDELREAAARLGTLSQLSVRHGHPPKFYGIRRQRYLHHADHPFPEPVMDGPPAQYDGTALAVWNEARKTPRVRETNAECDARRITKKEP